MAQIGVDSRTGGQFNLGRMDVLHKRDCLDNPREVREEIFAMREICTLLTPTQKQRQERMRSSRFEKERFCNCLITHLSNLEVRTIG